MATQLTLALFKGVCGTGNGLPTSYPALSSLWSFPPLLASFPSPMVVVGTLSGVQRNALTLARGQALALPGLWGGAWLKGSPLDPNYPELSKLQASLPVC